MMLELIDLMDLVWWAVTCTGVAVIAYNAGHMNGVAACRRHYLNQWLKERL